MDTGKKFFDTYSFTIGEGEKTAFSNDIDVYQDGTTPMYRDVDGRLWAMSGHSHMGHIAMFAGTCLGNMQHMWEAKTNFKVGNAATAFSGIRYPDGILPRGSIWPFGLYICPNTHRFFCWFHNETGWNGQGSAYDAYGPCNTPRFDSDFRHVGLMHSDDEGKSWTFDRWVLAGEAVGFTERYNPGDPHVLGQKGDVITLGSGDFSLFVEPQGEFIYIFYNIITLNLSASNDVEAWKHCRTYVARCRKRTDGVMGDFVKYYDGSFSESGIFGKETPVMMDAWHPRVVYNSVEKEYWMTSLPIIATMHDEIKDATPGGCVLQIAVSKDLVNWSEPDIVYKDGRPFGCHYQALVPNDEVFPPTVLSSREFSILLNHNGTNVIRYPVTMERKAIQACRL